MKKILCCVLAVVMLLSFVSCGSKLEWPDSKVAALIPQPTSNKGEINSSSNTYLSADVKAVSLSDYNDYVAACIEKGFTVDSEETGDSYDAYNKDGYKLHIYYYDSDEEMHITVDAPEEMGSIEWPTTGLGAMMPSTKSTIGRIVCDDSESFIVHVGETTIEEYKEYVRACENKGFNIDHSKEDKYYSATNKAGYEVTLRYLGFNCIEVSVSIPEEEDSDTNDDIDEEENSSKETHEDVSSKEDIGVSASFKETMDSYEAFMDEYVEFMEKYSKSDDVIGMLGEYTEFMSKYSDYMSKIQAIDQDELSVADAAYYLEVTTRVTQKLLKVSEK